MGRPPGSRNRNKTEKPPKAETAKKPRKTKAKAAPKAEAQPVSSPASAATSVNSGFKKPTPEQVKRLVKQIISRNNDARSISQTASEMVAKAVENQHFDKKAFGMVKSLYQMSINRPEAFAVTLPHLLAYIDDLGLAEAANEARGMDLEGEEDGEEGEETGTDQAEHDETPTTGASPRLSVVPGPNAPQSEVPAAPKDDEQAA